jgi:hypothetical protein
MQSETILSEKGMRRIFEGELIEVRTGAGAVHHLRALGFHFEDESVLTARGHRIDEYSRTTPDSRGVYRAGVILEGKQRRGGGGQCFFPYNWRRSQVMEAIAEAYASREAVNWTEQGRFYKGQTARGMRIVMELDEEGRVLNAFPLRAKTNKAREALYRIDRGLQKKSRYVCGRCQNMKRFCCPFGHGGPGRKKSLWSRIKKLAKVIRQGLK